MMAINNRTQIILPLILFYLVNCPFFPISLSKYLTQRNMGDRKETANKTCYIPLKRWTVANTLSERVIFFNLFSKLFENLLWWILRLSLPHFVHILLQHFTVSRYNLFLCSCPLWNCYVFKDRVIVVLILYTQLVTVYTVTKHVW